MKLVAVVALAVLVTLASANEGLKTKKFNQRLNHFSRDFTEWEQRYFVNQDYYYVGGPVFIYVSGKLDTFELLHVGEVYDFNKFVNGMLFGLEQRYFGESTPTENASTANLEYLTVEQATADIAHFIDHIKKAYPSIRSSKVILFGEDNGAALAVWARQKYPHLIDGVWASSAYVNPVINHAHLAINIGQTYRQVGGQRCYDVIANAFETLDLLVWVRRTDIITDSLKLCKSIDAENEDDVASLMGNLVQLLQNKLQGQSYQEIEDSCRSLTESEAASDFESFSNWFRYELFPPVACFNFVAKDMVTSFRNEAWKSVGTAGGDRQQFYLRCAQLGQFATSDADRKFQPFGTAFGLDSFMRFCDSVFGKNFTDDLPSENNRFQTAFGGLSLSVTNVFFTHGEFDPKITLGVTRDLNEDSPVVIIPLHTRGKDLRPASPNDAPALREAKRRAKIHLLKWILGAKSEEETINILERIGGVPF